MYKPFPVIPDQRVAPLEEQEMEMVRCMVCKEEVPVCYALKIGDMDVCEDCEASFYQNQASPGQCGAAYILEGETRYLKNQRLAADSDELFYNWWLRGLEKQDRLRILKTAYEAEKTSNSMAYYPDWEKDFCLESPDWKAFVNDRI